MKADPDETTLQPHHTHELHLPSPKPEQTLVREIVDLTTTTPSHIPAKSPHSPPSASPNIILHSSPGIVTLKYHRSKSTKSTKASPATAKSPDTPSPPRRQTRAMAKRKKLTKDNDWEDGVWDVGVNDFKEIGLKG